MEKIGIELCKPKTRHSPTSSYVFFHPEYFSDLEAQLHRLAKEGRMPAWMEDDLLFTGDPETIIEFYRKTLQVL